MKSQFQEHFFFMVIKISMENVNMTRGLKTRAWHRVGPQCQDQVCSKQFGQAQFRHQISSILSLSAALSDSMFSPDCW